MSKINFINGDIFQSKDEVIVCPSNAQGILGAGLAKTFKEMESVSNDFKEANEAYRDTCLKGLMAGGSCMYYAFKQPVGHLKGIVYCATKGYWSLPSKLEYVESGLTNLLKLLNYYKLNSVSLPMLGCGLGKLPEYPVEQAIKNTFASDCNNTRIINIYKYNK